MRFAVLIAAWRSDHRKPFTRALDQHAASIGSTASTKRNSGTTGGLVDVVEGFDVLVQLLIHRWGLVAAGDHLDVGGAIG